jgi:hypothetical protein
MFNYVISFLLSFSCLFSWLMLFHFFHATNDFRLGVCAKFSRLLNTDSTGWSSTFNYHLFWNIILLFRVRNFVVYSDNKMRHLLLSGTHARTHTHTHQQHMTIHQIYPDGVGLNIYMADLLRWFECIYLLWKLRSYQRTFLSENRKPLSPDVPRMLMETENAYHSASVVYICNMTCIVDHKYLAYARCYVFIYKYLHYRNLFETEYSEPFRFHSIYFYLVIIICV